MTTSSPNLAKIIGRDLISVGRLPLFLLLLIGLTAVGVVMATHISRQAITAKDHALVARDSLDNEWRNLMLEETSLAEHSRVQAIALDELNMKRPDADKEETFSVK